MIYSQMLTCSFNYVHGAYYLLSYSGRGLFHLGRYHDCIDNPAMKYSLIHLGINGTDSGAYTGLCLPKQCRNQDVVTYFNSAFKMLSTPYSIYSINTANQNDLYPVNWVSYITAFILLLLVTLVFAATVRFYKHSKKRQTQWLQCFDLTTNIRQHFKVRENQDLNAWDGVRAIAMMWVVIGHTYSTPTEVGVENIASLLDVAKKPFFLILEAGFLSVDMFLALGGFFLAFVMLRHKITAKICGLGTIQRILRICPPYFLTMMFLYSLFLRFGSGPIWSQAEVLTYGCKTMWKQMLFVGNLIKNGSQQCMGWGWYLQVDFQLFLLGIVLMYLYSRKRSIFMWTTLGLGLSSTVYIYVFTYVYQNKMKADLQGKNAQAYWQNIYIKPYGRCVPYLLGLLFGVFYIEYRTSIRNHTPNVQTFLSQLKPKLSSHKPLRIAIQWVGVCLMAFVALIPRPVQMGAQWPQAVHSLYEALSKPIFILGMFLTVLPSSLGTHTSFFNLVLNARILVYIARISFSTYLVHIFFIAQFFGSRSYDSYYNITDNFIIYMGLLTLSLLTGFLVTIIIEVPLSNLLKLALPNIKAKIKQPQTQTESLITNQSINETISKPSS